MNRAPRARHVWAALIALGLLAACGRGQDAAPVPAAAPAPPGGQPFTILAGSELKELEPALVEAGRSLGLDLRLEYAGTLDIVERINAGERFDALLPPNGAYPSLALNKPPVARDKLFYSRVALGVKPAVAQSLGWNRQTPTWAEVAAAAGAGKLRYAMTNPTASNTGMSALFAVASAAAGKTEDLQESEVDATSIKAFLSGQSLTAGSSGWLAEAFLREAARLDGMVNYEAVILRTNLKLAPPDRLQLIEPRDGVISADYPLMLLTAERRDDFQRLVQVLKAPAFQNAALPPMFLRPSNPEATAAAGLPTTVVSELSFPNRLDVIDAVLGAYQSQWRRPSTSILVLDTSGSMDGERMESMRQALNVLGGGTAGAGQTASSRYARFQDREHVILIPFSGKVEAPRSLVFDPEQSELVRAQFSRFVDGLKADGGTAIYSALERAQQVGIQAARREPDRFVSILLLTDGENNAGISLSEFERLPPAARPIRVFPILYGEGNAKEMKAVAELTGGRAFDARQTSLVQVFKEIRGYQ